MQAHPSQHFAASYAKDSPFTTRGLRTFWEYRDLGVAAATHGRFRAQVLRATRPSPPGGTGWHFHALEFQLYYVLRGFLRTQVEGQGELIFRAGDAFLQPPGTWHNVVAFCEELEMLELVSPADIGTVAGDPGAADAPLPPASAQRFTASYAERSPFERGLRAYFEYRDLGTRQGSGGLVQAHVLRAANPCPPEGTGWHYHQVDFQLVYVLQGSISSHLEGQGELTFGAGDCWLQPPGIRHCVKAYSDDLAQIEIVSPADFATVDVANGG
jgi:quercetin dioxygenase-like cupin family protein